MAVEKNFVVKNGLEVSESLLVANKELTRVGVKTYNPAFDLEVSGGIGATDLYVGAGASIGYSLFVGTANTASFSASINSAGISSVGINTRSPAYVLDVQGPVSTGQTALFVHGDAYITGTLNIGAGSSEGSDIIIDGNVEVIGITTFENHVDINNSLNVVGPSTFIGVTSFMDNIYVDGDIIFTGDLLGDGSALSGIVTQIVPGAGINISPASGTGIVQVSASTTNFVGNIGISTGSPDPAIPDTFIGVGVTNLVFQSTTGTGVTVSNIVGGASTVSITPGISIGLAIALGGK